MKPLVSVCVLTYNHEKYIRQCLEGIMSQKCSFPFEVLIHDDASSDGTAEIIREFEERYPDVIKPIYETENQYSKGMANISALFNFPRAAGRYIAMCEGDDYWNDESKLEKQISYMELNEGCTISFHSAHMISDGKLAPKLMRPYRSDLMIDPEDIIDKTVGYPMASMIVRTKIMMELPDFYMDAPIGDIPMQLLMAAHGYGWYIDEPMCTYRYGVPGSFTAGMFSEDAERIQSEYAVSIVHMYEQYDSYTHEKYHEAVLSAARRVWYSTMVNLKKWDEIFSEENRPFYKELTFLTRLGLRFERYFPGLYRLLKG